MIANLSSLKLSLAVNQEAKAALEQQVASLQAGQHDSAATAEAQTQLQQELEELRAENANLYDAAATSRQVRLAY